MSLFDRTFLISTGVTAVICGAIYYYLNSKIRELEQALVKQNQVLSSFIANVQQEFRAMARANGMGANGGGSGVGENGMTFEMVTGSNELASPEALAAVAELDNRKIVITESVCDSSSEDDDSACETDASETDASETDASEAGESDNDEEDEEHDNKLIICDLPVNDMKIIDMSSLGISQLEIYTPEKQSEDEADAIEADASEADASEADASETDDSAEESDSEEDGFHRVTKLVIGDDKLTVSDQLKTTSKIEDIQIEELSTSDSVETPAPVPAPVPVPVPAPAPKENPKYDDLKVDELRKVLLEKGLAQKEEVKKLKKNELLAILKKSTF